MEAGSRRISFHSLSPFCTFGKRVSIAIIISDQTFFKVLDLIANTGNSKCYVYLFSKDINLHV